jgi:hypothetical protein
LLQELISKIRSIERSWFTLVQNWENP